jgi:hypothetical protein
VGWTFEEDLILALALVGAGAAVAFFRGGMLVVPIAMCCKALEHAPIYTRFVFPCGAESSSIWGRARFAIVPTPSKSGYTPD